MTFFWSAAQTLMHCGCCSWTPLSTGCVSLSKQYATALPSLPADRSLIRPIAAPAPSPHPLLCRTFYLKEYSYLTATVYLNSTMLQQDPALEKNIFKGESSLHLPG